MPQDKKKIILLVEDDPIIAMSESIILKKYGYSVVSVSTGEKAVETVENSSKINLILMDIDLGKGISGTDAAVSILKKHEIPVLFISNHSEPEIVQKTEGITSYGYVLKNSGEAILIASISMAFRLYETRLELEEKKREIEATNEELQSTVEELEESNEELLRSQEELLKGKIELQEKELLFHYLFYNMLNGFALCKMIFENEVPVDFIYVEVNPSFEHQTGLKNVVGKKVSEVIPGILDTDRDLIETYGRVSLSGVPETFETYLKSLDMWFSVSVYSPKKYYFVAVFDVITEKKKHEIEMKDLNERLSLSQEAAEIGVWDWDIITDEISWSPKMFDLFGLDKGNHTASFDAWRKILHPDDKINAERKIQIALENHSTLYNTYRVVHSDGKTRWIYAIGKGLYGPDDKPERMIGTCMDITGRILIEEKLSNTIILLKETFEQSPIPMVLVNMPEGVIMAANTASRKVLGIMDEPDPEGLILSNYIPSYKDFDSNGKLTPIGQAPLALALKGTKTINQERKIVTKDGTVKWILVSGTPIYNSNNEIIAGYLTFPEITDQKNHERERDRLINIIESTSDIVAMANFDGSLIYINNAGKKLLEWEGEEFKTKTIKDAHSEKAFETLINEALPGAVNNGIWNHEINILKKDGSEIPVSQVILYHYYADNDKAYFSTIIRDISERKLIENTLRESEEKIRILLDESTDTIFSFTENGQYLYANKAFAEEVEKNINEIIGKFMWEVIGRENTENRLTALKEVFVTGKVKVIEGRISRSDGNRYYITTITPIKNSEGKVISALCSSKDITERRNAEIAIKELLEEKELLLKEVHHRVKNNMNITKSILNLHAKTLDDPASKSAILDADSRLHSMGLLYDKLYLSENMKEMSLKDYLPPLVTDIINLFPANEKIRLIIDVTDIKIGVKLLSAIGIIINELITNIMKYAFMETSEGSITLTTRSEGKKLFIDIIDDGSGIPENFNIKESSGFGLQLVSILANQHGGKITIKKNHGTQVAIEFVLPA